MHSRVVLMGKAVIMAVVEEQLAKVDGIALGWVVDTGVIRVEEAEHHITTREGNRQAGHHPITRGGNRLVRLRRSSC